MSIDVQAEFRRGGRTLLDFLTYCVLAYVPEPLFAYLVHEYRLRPTNVGALAIYDTFCAPAAPVRLRAGQAALPPQNVRFAVEMEAIRSRLLQAVTPPAAEGDDPPAASAAPAPRKYLFDPLMSHLEGLPESPIAAPAGYDPALSPHENLPGGRMSPGQRAWVDNVWQPRVRPMLVAGGFWRISTIG